EDDSEPSDALTPDTSAVRWSAPPAALPAVVTLPAAAAAAASSDASPAAWADDPRATSDGASQPHPAWKRTGPRALVGVAAVASLSVGVWGVAARPCRSEVPTLGPEGAAALGSATPRPRTVSARSHSEVGQHRLRAGDHR